MNHLPYEHRFIAIYEPINGGYVKIHAEYVPGKDHDVLLKIAMHKADKGDKVEILPILNENDPNRDKIFNGGKPNKNPDFRINGLFVEVEGVTKDKYSTISEAIRHGHVQANHVIINLTYELTYSECRRIAKGRLNVHIELQSVEFYYNGISIGIFT